MSYSLASYAPPDSSAKASPVCLPSQRLLSQGARLMTSDGTHTHTSSLRMTLAPVAEKKFLPTGEECIGRQGRKKRAELNGAKNATPQSPFTSASSTACEAVTAKK